MDGFNMLLMTHNFFDLPSMAHRSDLPHQHMESKQKNITSLPQTAF
jgi:uncharacterized protein involved in cysteine biosynthesis